MPIADQDLAIAAALAALPSCAPGTGPTLTALLALISNQRRTLET
ncbi:MAG TPA: hypothetical protein VGI64_03925 [Streptosporangiaceae bacterium]